MSIFAAALRLILSLGIFYAFVVLWAMVPFFDEKGLPTGYFLSIFFGSNPLTGWSRDLILLSRCAFGLMASLYIFIPCLRVLFEFDPTVSQQNTFVILSSVCIVAFLAALVVYHLYYL